MDKRARAIRSDCSLVPLHQCDQLLDMGDRRIRKDSMPEIEDVRSAGESVKDSPRRLVELSAAGEQGQRVEIALHGKVIRKLLRRPGRIDRLVEPERA